jgi:sarcosine oxidase
MIGRPDSPVVAGTLESARRWSLPHDVLDSAAMRSRFPQFALSDDQIAVFEADAGFVRAEASILANLELALDAGAELWFDTEVEAVELGPGGVYLSTGEAEVVAPRAVLATGAWAPRLANLHQFPITVQRQTMHWFEPVSTVADFTADRFPVYVWDRPVPPGGTPAELYGFPYLPGDVGVKAGLYHDGDGSDVEPDALDRVVTEADAARLADQLETALPTLGGKWVSGAACMYPGVPDDDFVLGIHPGSSGRIVLAIGFSGHGFKFHPVVGEIVADLVTDGTTGHDIEFLSPNRLPRTT